MSKETVRLGVVGAGNIARTHLRASQRHETGVNVVAVCDIIEERAREKAEQFNIPAVFTDHRQMLHDADLDAVLVTTSNAAHHEVAINCLEAGKHVLCEKPMTVDTAKGEEMVNAARENGKILAVGMVNRFRSSAQTARSLMDSGRLGRPYYAKAMRIRSNGIPGWGSWFTQKDQSGGGPLIDLGVHALDLAWYIMGQPRPVSVKSYTFSELGPSGERLGNMNRVHDLTSKYDVEDLAVALVKFENGAVLNLETSWVLNMEDENRLSVVGDKAGVKLLADDLTLYYDNNGELSAEAVDTGEKGTGLAFAREMLNFTSAILKGSPVLAPGEQGLEVVRMLEGIYTSAASGEEVAL